MAATDQATKFTLTLNETERVQLLTLLEREIRDTHAEARRTESPDYQDAVHQQEDVLHELVKKLRRA
jgi:hypothetical protein